MWRTSHPVEPDECDLITFQLRYPRCIHAQVLMHRSFARNAASNRARPVTAMVDDVVARDWVPAWRLRAQRGMQPSAEPVPDDVARVATSLWRAARAAAVDAASRLADLRIAKELANRVLEPFQLIDVVMTGTRSAWDAFVDLRSHDTAQTEIRHLALDIAAALVQADLFASSGHHLPYTDPTYRIEVGGVDVTEAVAVARCARVSYRPFDRAQGEDFAADLDLFHRLVTARPMHASPLEHVARPVSVEPGQLFSAWTTLRHDPQWLADVCARVDAAQRRLSASVASEQRA
jgi:thymidylate synthase ThyX